VKAYWEYWARVSAAVTDQGYEAADLHFSHFYRDADAFFTPRQSMARPGAPGPSASGREGRRRERGARRLPGGRPAQRRTDARDTARLPRLSPERQARGLHRGDGRAGMTSAARMRANFIANMSFLEWAEGLTWDRELIKLMATPALAWPTRGSSCGTRRKVGESQKWFAPDFDPSSGTISTRPAAYEKAGHRRAVEGGARSDYLASRGIALRRRACAWQAAAGTVDLRRRGRGLQGLDQWRTGSWRPYPYQGDTDSWRESFEVDITRQIRPGGPNVIAVRVENNLGDGGSGSQCGCAPASARRGQCREGRRLRDGPVHVGAECTGGQFRFLRDTTMKHGGTASGCLNASPLARPRKSSATARRPGDDGIGRIRRSRRARELRAEGVVPHGCRLPGRRARLGDRHRGGTMEVKGLNTQGVWRELKIAHIKPLGNSLGLYLNVFEWHGQGVV